MRKDHFTDEALANAKALADIKSQDVESFAEAYDFARCQRPDGSFYGTSGQCRKGTPAGAKEQEAKKGAKTKAPASAKAKASAPAKSTSEKISPERRKSLMGDKWAKNEISKLAKMIKIQERDDAKAISPADTQALAKSKRAINKMKNEMKKLIKGEKVRFEDSRREFDKGRTDDDHRRIKTRSADAKAAPKAERREPGKTKVANSAPKKPAIKTDFRKDTEAGAKIRRERDAAIEKLQGRQMRLRKAYAKANRDAAAAIRAKDPARAEKVIARVAKLGEALDSANDMMRKYTGNQGNTGGRIPNKLEKGG